MTYPGTRSLIQAAASLAESQPYADRISRKGQDVKTAKARAAEARRKADEIDALVGDDGVPPQAPIGIVVTPFFRSLIVSWIDPPESDMVSRSIIEVTPQGGSVSTYRGSAYGITIENLEAAKSHTLRVRLQDRFGRLSGWSTSVSATPMRTVADEIDLTKAEIAGSLGWDNLDALDANSGLTLAQRQAKLGDDVITARAMATQNLAATRLWAQTGAFESAMIGSLAVDKLTAGTFTAGQIVLAGSGALMAGRIRLDSTGITLPPIDAFNSPIQDRDYKISSGGDFAAVSFFRDETAAAGLIQGIGMRIDGNQFRKGAFSLRATNNGNAANADTGVLDIYSESPGGVVATNSRFYVFNQAYVGPRLFLFQNGGNGVGAVLELAANGKLLFGGREVAFV